MLINPAWAQAPGGGALGGGFESMILIVLMFGSSLASVLAVMWVIRRARSIGLPT